MRRPTIQDLAKAAGVSVATVNRVVGGAGGVRDETMQKVREAAHKIGFYGIGTIERRIEAARPKHRLGFLLNQPGRVLYQDFAASIRHAAVRFSDAYIEPQIEFLEDLSPQNVAHQLRALSRTCEAIGVVAAVHPLINEAIDEIRSREIPVFALVSPLASSGLVSYIGLDAWKQGRMAAWSISHICRQPGKIGLLVGNHRYRCQELSESGFRSYFREYDPDFTILEPLSTFESSAIAEEMTEKLLRENPDLTALYVNGGGISGATRALRAHSEPGKIVVIAHDLMEVTRKGLLDGTITMVLSHPIARFGEEAISAMVRALNSDNLDATNQSCIMPFEVYTRENI